jgi:haloacetate dehalogenase
LLSNRVPTEGAAIFVRAGGSGPPLLLHGYPQTHVCWHTIASELARHVTLVLADLRGYGSSSAPPGDAEHKTYSKGEYGDGLSCRQPARLHAVCEDYRAGLSIDRELDEADLALGRKIT